MLVINDIEYTNYITLKLVMSSVQPVFSMVLWNLYIVLTSLLTISFLVLAPIVHHFQRPQMVLFSFLTGFVCLDLVQMKNSTVDNR